LNQVTIKIKLNSNKMKANKHEIIIPKNKNIFVISTEKPSRLYSKDGNHKLDNSTMAMDWYISSVGYKPHNIYITSDEVIKEGDWVLIESDYDKQGLSIKKYDFKDKHYDNCLFKKIILTTDKDLDGVQAIPDEFLEWFCKNPSCDEVEIIYGLFNPMGRQVDPNNVSQNHSQCIWKYKIIIPKEEPKQRLEKYSERFDNKDNELVEGVFNPDTWGKRLIDETEHLLSTETNKKRLLEEVEKQETLEETIGLKAHKYSMQYEGTDKYTVSMLAIEFGYNLVQEDSYSEEDMLNFAWFLIKNIGQYSDDRVAHFEGKYLEQFKKK